MWPAPPDFWVSATATGPSAEERRSGITQEEMKLSSNKLIDLSCGFKFLNILPFLLEAFLFLADIDPRLRLFSYYSLLCALYGGES